jgi:hypothetical protein
MILLYMIALSVAVAYIRGGRLKYYLDKPLKGIFLPVVAFALEAALELGGPKLLAPMVILEYLLLFVFIFLNRRIRAIWLVAVGVALNALVIFASGFRMPVTPVVFHPALSEFAERVKAGQLIEYVLVGWDAPLWFLGDTVPITRVVPGIASIGDIVMAAGMFWLLQYLMAPPRKGDSDSREGDSESQEGGSGPREGV